MQIGRLARMGSIISLLVAVLACSNQVTPTPTAGASSTPPSTPSSSPNQSRTPSPIPSPSASPRHGPRPMARATLKRGPTMTLAREYQMAVRLADGRVVILGGYVPFVGKCMAFCYLETASVEVYDPGTGKFSHAGSLAEADSSGIALPLPDGRVLVDGSSIEIYDPATKTSSEVKLPNGLMLSGAAVALIAGRRVLFAGGPIGSPTSTTTWIFDPASGSFISGPLMGEPCQGATAMLLRDGSVLLVGGGGDTAEVLKPLDPLSRSTLVSPGDPALGFPATSTLLSDGRVLVSGGSSCAGCSIPAAAEIFDPTTKRFTPVGPMVTPRTRSTAVALPDGRALVIGGQDAKGAAVGAIEAFDPGSDTFQVVATGFPDISGFTATLLEDGQVLIAGGLDSNLDYSSATWLIKP